MIDTVIIKVTNANSLGLATRKQDVAIKSVKEVNK